MRFSEALSDSSLKKLADRSVRIGNVYFIPMDESNGVTPKDGNQYRNKYFVVLGWNDHEIYGGVIVNSKINQKIPEKLRIYHMPIKCDKYSFLRYDSFINCSELKEVPLSKFWTWKFVGYVIPSDVDIIVSTIKRSPIESPAHLKVFGL